MSDFVFWELTKGAITLAVGGAVGWWGHLLHWYYVELTPEERAEAEDDAW